MRWTKKQFSCANSSIVKKKISGNKILKNKPTKKGGLYQSFKRNKPHSNFKKNGKIFQKKKIKPNDFNQLQNKPEKKTRHYSSNDDDASRKRVSFSNTLEHSRTIDDVIKQQSNDRKVSNAIPEKGILRTKDELKEINVLSEHKLPSMELKGTNNKKSSRKYTIKVKHSTNELLAKMDKKERKAFIHQLKEKKRPYYNLSLEAKELWEKIRSSKCKAEEKEKCVLKLMELVKGKLKSLIFAHDTCRVIECLFALNREDIRSKLFDELTPEIVRMSKSVYAKFFVSKILKYGNKSQREIVINAIYGHCVLLFKTSTSAKIVEKIYNDYATSLQRFNIVSEFYGPEYVLFRNELSGVKSLEEIVERFPAKILSIVKNLEEVLEKVINKETLKHSLTHKLLYDYMLYCNLEQKQSIIESIKTNLPEIAHTREGSRVAMICIWNAEVKDRKTIVKSFKGLTLNACKDQFARRVLFAIFDCVDDTTLVNKYITLDISNNIAELAYDKNGASVLHYLMHPRDHRYFGKWINIMNEGDLNEHSKKEAKLRYSELFQCINKNLFAFLAANMPTILMKKEAATLVLNALEPPEPTELFQRVVNESDKEACFKEITKILGQDIQPYHMKDEPHILRYGPPRFVFRGLMRLEPKQNGAKLSHFIADLPRDHLSSFVTLNCGCFALIEMMQSGSDKAKQAVLDAVNIATLKHSALVGAKALLEEITTCLQTKVTKAKNVNFIKKK